MSNAVGQMFERCLEPIKGWFEMHALDRSAKLDSTLLTNATAVPAGRVAHLASDGEFELGATGHQMPIFLWQGKADPDVYNNGTSPITNVTRWWGISPTGVMNGLVATGGYELQTSEFDTTQDYAANDLLKADADGKLTNDSVTLYTDLVCGVCSFFQGGQAGDPAPTSPVGTNAHGVEMLQFWSVYLPGA